MVCSGIRRGTSHLGKWHRLLSSPRGTLPIVVSGRGWQGASTRSHAGSTHSRESARLRCCDSEQQNPQGGCQPGVQAGTPTRPSGDIQGTFAGSLFGLLVWTSKADAAGSRMGSESRFGKAGVVSLSTQVLFCFRIFAPAHRKLLLSASRQKSCPTRQAPAYQHAEERQWELPAQRKPSGRVGTGQERSARHPFAAAGLNWAQTLRRHPHGAGTATKSGRRVF
jgi:hypothetical protein